MRRRCERREAPLTLEGAAFICCYECTFCTKCAAEMSILCPNCGGELVHPPRQRAGWRQGRRHRQTVSNRPERSGGSR